MHSSLTPIKLVCSKNVSYQPLCTLEYLKTAIQSYIDSGCTVRIVDCWLMTNDWWLLTDDWWLMTNDCRRRGQKNENCAPDLLASGFDFTPDCRSADLISFRLDCRNWYYTKPGLNTLLFFSLKWEGRKTSIRAVSNAECYEVSHADWVLWGTPQKFRSAVAFCSEDRGLSPAILTFRA